ncbi:MAG: serine/threonine-protein kinase, partial [Deltaproteobacteria bacterium]
MEPATPERDAPKYPHIGRYELLGEIASGGMATVFLGRAIGVKGFARLVAIKKLHPHLEREEDFVAAFLDEARLAARIRHPNVVPTLDVDDQDGLYIVLEYVEGDRLLGLLRHAVKEREPIPVPIALKIAVETLSGLHAAHELKDDDGKPLNLVHRDVSPQNVLIGIDGVTKITDFGIAKAESRLVTTRDGQLKGKISYMPPEQARGGAVDRRVDVFAMGILLWEMLTSRRLFKGDNDVEVLSQVLSLPIPSACSVVPTLPVELDAIVMKALQREPELRHESALAFAVALEDVAHLVGGLAPTRVVARYVERVAGPKLEAERERIRS